MNKHETQTVTESKDFIIAVNNLDEPNSENVAREINTANL